MHFYTRQFKERWALFAILVLAFVLRVYGANFGLPYLYAWDEPQVVTRALRFASGDLNPHFFYYPALYMYILFFVNSLFFVLAYLVGIYNSAAEFAATFLINPSNVYLISRITTAIFGTACVLVTYRIGSTFFDRRVGLFAALFLSVSVVHVTYSHIAVTDIAQAFFITLVALWLNNVATRGTMQDYVLCGVFIGLGAATKYLAALAIPSLFFAHFAFRKSSPRPLMLSLAAFCGSFFIASPFTFLDFRGVIHDFRSQLAIASNWAGLSNSSALVTIVNRLVPGDIGWPLFIMAIIGLLVLGYRHKRTEILFLSFPTVYLLFLIVFQQPWERYFVPETPFVCLMAGVALIEVWDWVNARTKKSNIGFLWLAATFLIAEPLLCVLWWDITTAHCEDTRTTALRWAEDNIPAGTAVAIQTLWSHTVDNVPLLTDHGISRIEQNIPTNARFSGARDFVLTELRKRPAYHLVDFTYNAKGLKEAGVRYVFMTDASFDNDRLLKEKQFRQTMVLQAKLVKRFENQAWGRAFIPVEVSYPVQPPIISVFEMGQDQRDTH